VSFQRYLYRRERADGSTNQSTSLKTFEKWLGEIENGDRFYVAECRWVEAEQDGTVRWTSRNGGVSDIAHVRKIRDIEPEGE
jgi:hypothetical protein